MKSGGGVPFASVYGTYTATSGACQLSTTAVGYTISDWGYCDNSTGIAQTALIKQAMLTYGPISVCIAADGPFENYSGGVFKDDGYSQVNHQVIVVGWDDSKGAWKLRNSWGTSWGDPSMPGYGWIAYGANQVGTEAMWAMAGTPIILQPSKPPKPPKPTPTRRMAELLATLPDLVDAYNSGDPTKQATVLSTLDKIEGNINGAKKSLGLAK